MNIPAALLSGNNPWILNVNGATIEVADIPCYEDETMY